MGIDVGSSGCKASVIDEAGKLVSFSTREYSFTYENGNSELDANVVWESVFSAVCELGNSADLSELKTISVTSFGEMFVLLDENYNVLAPTISYEDLRGTEEMKEIQDPDKIYNITGAVPDAMYGLLKLLWIKKNQPEIYRKAKYMCMLADFILFRLGAVHHTDYSLAARTLMFDVRNKCWADEIFDMFRLDKSICGKLVPSGTDVGKISASVAKAAKLSPEVKLLSGGHDQPCAALGAGIIKPGIALDGMGSNECIVPALSSPMINKTMKESNLVCVPHIVPQLYVTYAFNRTAGSLFKWYNNLTGSEGYETLTQIMPENPTDLLVLPHFAGAATPYMDNESVGAVLGLKTSTTKGELAKGIIEGINYEMLINLKCLEKAGFGVEMLYASGGLSKSDKILQIKADILGIPVTRLKNSETGTVGTAILGGIAMGIYKNFEEAIETVVKTDKVFVPDMEKHMLYMNQFKKYEKLYLAVKGVIK